jgi:hypothetical protein
VSDRLEPWELMTIDSTERLFQDIIAYARAIKETEPELLDCDAMRKAVDLVTEELQQIIARGEVT